MGSQPEQPEQSKQPDEEPLIQLDKLPHEMAPSYSTAHPAGGRLDAVLARFGGPMGGREYATPTPDGFYKFRIFNSDFISLAILAVLLPAGGIFSLVLAIEGHLYGLILAPLLLLAGAWLIHDLPRSSCVIVTPVSVIVKGAFLTQTLPIGHIVSATVFDRGLGRSGGFQVILHTATGFEVYTPLTASQSLAGRTVVTTACDSLEQVLKNRRRPQAAQPGG